MQPGKAFSRSSEILRTFMSATPTTADAFSWQSSGSQRRAQPGALYPKPMDIGTLSIAGLAAGAMPVFFKHYMNTSTMPEKFQLSSLIAQPCVPIPAQPGPRKKRRARSTMLGSEPGGGFTTKLNLSLSDECVPLRWTLTAGQCHDITQAPALIQGYSCQYVIGDKAYDSDAFIAEITSRDAVAVIPPRKNRKEPRTYDQELYKRRNLIERFFNWLKQYRRVATRYDKLGVRFLGFVYLASILIKNKQNVNTT